MYKRLMWTELGQTTREEQVDAFLRALMVVATVKTGKTVDEMKEVYETIKPMVGL